MSETVNDFQQFHNDMRALRRRGFIRVDAEGQPLVKFRTPYVRPKAANEVKGKQARKIAKRERRLAREAACSA